MITVSNYNEKKNQIDWSKMPKQIAENRNDVEGIMEFYNDDKDIKETVDLFLKGINDNTKEDKPENKPAPKKAAPKSDSQQKIDAMEFKKGDAFNIIESIYADFPYLETRQKVSGAIILQSTSYEGNKNIYSFTKNADTITISKEHFSRGVFLGKIKQIKSTPKKETLQDAILDAPLVRSLMPKLQLMAVLENDESEEVQYFIDKIKELEAIFVDAKKIDDKTPLMDKIVKLHYFYGSTDWFIFDYDQEDNVFFGYVVLNGDTEMAEAGYISVDEIMSVKRIELDFNFDQKPLGKVLHFRYPNDYPAYKPEAKKDTATPAKKSTAKPKTKPKAVIHKTFVDNFSTEFQLIRRFFNIIKDENEEIPFRKTQLLFMAFNKAALERKVRKTSDVADIFNQCNEKMRILFEEFAAPTQAPIKVQFSDKKLFKQIEDYVSDVAINPAVQVLKRFVAIQNTFPEIAKAETLKKAIEKVIDTDKNNRLSNELKDAVKWINEYVKNPKHPVDTEIYGLSAPRSVCTNRIKCAGIDKNGKLHKGYKFEEHTGHIIRTKKQSKRTPATKKKMTAGSLGYSINENYVENIVIESNKPASVQPMVAPLQQVQNISVPQETIEQSLPTDQQPTAAPVQQVKNALMDMEFESLEMDGGWEEFMQNPAKNLKIGISGKPKNGKTAGSLQLANYLTKFGNVLYNFVDQGFNKSTKDLWIMSGLSTNKKAVPSDIRTLDELEKEIKTGKYSFVFIDMINDYIDMEKITPQEFKDRFIVKYPNVGFILVFEVTKRGDFKGDQKWMHVVDAIAEVENFCMEIRGRYGMGHHVIWEEGLQQYNPKKYAEIYGEIAAPINSDVIETI